MKKALFVALAVLGIAGYFASCAMAADSDKASGPNTSSYPVKEAVMAAPNAVAAGTEAAAPVVADTVQAVATPVADAASAVAAPITEGDNSK